MYSHGVLNGDQGKLVVDFRNNAIGVTRSQNTNGGCTLGQLVFLPGLSDHILLPTQILPGPNEARFMALFYLGQS